MPTTSLMPPIKTQFFDSNGNPAAGGKVYTWQTGTNNTAKATYTDSTGTVENTNPVTLDSSGRAAIWLNGYYHIQAYDASGNLIADTDNVSSLPFTSAGTAQWVDQNLTFTYIDGTNFSVPGVYTSTFETGARVKAVVTAGTIYGTVVSSTSGGSPVVTTVTMTWDSGTLDDGLSTVSVGIITPSNSAQIGATYADLVKLHAVTATYTEVNTLASATSTPAASKAAIRDANAIVKGAELNMTGETATFYNSGTSTEIALGAVTEGDIIEFSMYIKLVTSESTYAGVGFSQKSGTTATARLNNHLISSTSMQHSLYRYNSSTNASLITCKLKIINTGTFTLEIALYHDGSFSSAEIATDYFFLKKA